MANDQTNYQLELGDTLQKLEQLFRGYNKEAEALENVITKSAKYNQAGEMVSRTIQASIDDHKILTATLKQEDDAFRVASAAIRDNTQALLENDRAMQARKMSQSKSAAQGFISRTRPDLSGASTDERLAITQANRDLINFAERNRTTGRDIQRVWNEVTSGVFKNYSGALGGLQQRLINIAKAHGNIGTESQKLWQTEKRRLETSARQTQQTLRQAKMNINSLADEHLGRQKVTQGIQSNTEAVKAQNKEVHSLLLSWKSLGRLVVINLMHQQIFALTQQIREAVRGFVDLEIALAEIQTLTRQISHDQAVSILFDQSNRFGLDILDQADAAYEALSNQIGNTEAELRQFMDTVNEFALVTKSTAQDSSDLISAVMNSYSLSVAEADEISQSLFATIDLGRLRAEDLANSIGRVLVPAKQLGLAYEEVFAALTLMTQQGIKADVAQTLLRNVMLKMAKPTEAMVEAFNQMGVSSGVAAVETFGLMGTMQQLFNVTGGGLEEIADLFRDIRAIGGAAIFADGNLQKFGDTLDQIRNSTEAYDRALNIVTENVGIKFRKALTETRNFFINDITGPVIESIGDMTNDFEDVVELVKIATHAVTALLIPAVGALITKVAVSAATFASLHPVIFGVTAAIGTLSLAIAAFNEMSKRQEREAIAAIRNQMTTRQIAFEERVRQERDLSNTLQELMKDRTRVTLQVLTEQASMYQRNIDDIISQYENMEDSVKDINKSIAKSMLDNIKRIQREYDKLIGNIESNQRRLTSLRTGREDALFANSITNLDPEQQLAAINQRIFELSREAQAVVSTVINANDLTSIDALNRQQEQVDNLIDRIKDLNRERSAILTDDTQINQLRREQQINEIFNLEISLIEQLAVKEQMVADQTHKMRLRNIAIEEQARAHFALVAGFDPSDVATNENIGSLTQTRSDLMAATDFIARNLASLKNVIGDDAFKDVSGLDERASLGATLISERLDKLEAQNLVDETRELLKEAINVEKSISSAIEKVEATENEHRALINQLQQTLVKTDLNRTAGATPFETGLFAAAESQQLFNRLSDFVKTLERLDQEGLLEGINTSDVRELFKTNTTSRAILPVLQEGINETLIDELRDSILSLVTQVNRGKDFTTDEIARRVALDNISFIEKLIPSIGLESDTLSQMLSQSGLDRDLQTLIIQLASLRESLEILEEGGAEQLIRNMNLSNEAQIFRQELQDQLRDVESLDKEDIEAIKRSLESIQQRFETGDTENQQSSIEIGDINIELASSGNEDFDARVLADAIYREIESGAARPFPTGATG